MCHSADATGRDNLAEVVLASCGSWGSGLHHKLVPYPPSQLSDHFLTFSETMLLSPLLLWSEVVTDSFVSVLFFNLKFCLVPLCIF